MMELPVGADPRLLHTRSRSHSIRYSDIFPDPRVNALCSEHD